MNLIGFVFSLLLIFVCMFSTSSRKAHISHALEHTYQEHAQALRKMRCSYESFCYQRLREKKKESHHMQPSAQSRPSPSFSPIQYECARLNLWPLLENPTLHPALYKLAASSLGYLYGHLLREETPRFEYALLDAILSSAKTLLTQDTLSISLEKLRLKDQTNIEKDRLQKIYYQILKGQNDRYPSLLDYFCIDKTQEKFCIKHASCKMLFALFGEKHGAHLYHLLHQSENLPTLEQLRNIAKESQLPSELLDWILYAPSHRTKKYVIFVQQESEVYLKKRFFLPQYNQAT